MYNQRSGGYGRSITSIYGSSPRSMYGAQNTGYSSGATGGAYSSGGYGAGPGKATSHEDYVQPSMLEVAVKDAKPMKTAANYMAKKDKIQLYLNNRKYISSNVFLAPQRPATPMIEDESEIMHYIKETFEKLVKAPFPEDHLKVHVLDDKAFEKAHGPGGKFGPGIQGFALNRQGKGINEVFVRKNHLDHMMLTIGHEIGHVMSKTLPDDRDEEAKAFAFSVAWMNTIKEHNIAGIGNSVMPNPARNGLHDVAFEYLLDLIEKGKGALQLFKELADGAVSITRRLEVIYR